ncbi:hypothetical protein MD484_g8535, partial [Candolleomyces efflorescens]
MSSNTLSNLPTAPVNFADGSGPLLSSRSCIECRESHLNPAFLTFTEVPPEVVERILGNVVGPLELQRLSRICSRFRALAMYVMYGRVRSLLHQFGITDDRSFLRRLNHDGMYWAGPSLLRLLFPLINPNALPYGDRLEIHVSNSAFLQAGLFDFLLGCHYTLAEEYHGARRVESFASDELEYPHFGRTVKRILRFTNNVQGITKSVIVFVSKSEITGFLSITEYPTTLFMVYIDGINLHVVYPWLTGNSRGLVNLPFPGPAANANPPFFQRLSNLFDLKRRISDWPEYRFHFCEQNVNCPLRLRHQLDNRGSSIGCSLDHPDLRPYRRRDPTRIFPPLFPRQAPTLCIWRLRCCGSCLAGMPFPGQDVSHRGLYAARDMYISDHTNHS